MDSDNFSFIARHQDVLDRLGNREPSTVLEAQAVIESIRAEKGYLDDATQRDLNTMPARSRQNIQRIIEAKRETEAAYTKSISEQLYSSKYRFLYELIQNADDSLYTIARKKLASPYLRFRVTPSEFIVETNEDGFTRANIEAICATGKSSKKASALDNHIGEKGFGFKSVFAVADEVHIQSGIWSFRFMHRQGDDGLGMVTPLDAAVEALSEGVTTRMRLTLSDNARRYHKRLLGALSDLPDTTIFFLRHLRTMEIHVIGTGSLETKTVIIKHPSLLGSKPCIQRTVEQFGAETTKTTEENGYHVFTHTVDPMPGDERRKGRKCAQIDLAFPLTSDQQPKLSEFGQHAFAYLPLQRLPQVPFLIQSDFITAANRESVVDCEWNDAILEGVAKAFTKAVAAFATSNHPLRYSWLDYLPAKQTGEPWRNLLPSIKTLLQNMPILQTWEKKQFKRPSQLRRLSSDYVHEEKPLFRDLHEEIYLAPEYNHKHHTTLKDLGTSTIDWDAMLKRISADLVKSDSYIKTRAPDHPWHEVCARLLSSTFGTQGNQYARERIRKLAIIPLSGGNSWTGAPGVGPGGVPNLYFPDTEGIDIPRDISLYLVEEQAASNASRRELFRRMGVKSCPTATVISQIEMTQRSPTLRSLDCRRHSRYLFYFHSPPEELCSWLYVQAGYGATTCTRASKPLYFPSDREYDTQQLLPAHFLASKNTVATLLHKDYVNLVPPTVRCQNLSWIEWLRRATGARYHPPLMKTAAYELSGVVLAVLEHSPEKFVGMLRAHWTEYKSYVPYVKSRLMGCKVPCESGATLPLQKTYLPTVEIKARLDDLGAESGFPLLKLPSVLDETNQQEWRFLEELGVNCDLDNKFYEIILRQMMESEIMSKERVARVYDSMARGSMLQDQEQLRSFFGSCQSIAFEDSHNVLKWTTPSECLWDGPEFLTVKVPLKYQYGQDQETHLKTFFSILLGIRDFKREDVLDELDRRRTGSQTESWSIVEATKAYELIESTVQTNAEWKTIRDAFNQRSLVMGAGGRWHTLQSCLWNSPFSLAEYEDLSTVYPTLKSFFVNHLKVKNANPAMLINELSRMASDSEPRVADIRQRLTDVGRMVAKSKIDRSLSDALDRLREVSFLPIKAANGNSVLVSVNDDFAILDHERFGAAFADQSILLDFALDEVQILDTIFRYMRLTHRYLSAAVKEVSTVGEDAVQNEVLEQALQAKAYALYCCATKYKSVKALRGERELFDHLSCAQIYSTDNISTHLILEFSTKKISVQSDRLALHHEVSDGQLKIYVPEAQRLRAACYRSQLPNFLTAFLGATASATFTVSEILRTSPRDLDDILQEHDVPHVDWIERPVIEASVLLEDESPSTLTPTEHTSRPDAGSLGTSSVSATPSRAHFAPESTADQSRRSSRTWVNDDPIVSPQTPLHHYERLVEQVWRSAQRASDRQQPAVGNNVPIRNAPPSEDPFVYDHDHIAAFGDRDANEMVHDKKIGALGEAYVFEILSNLNLPNFNRGNWRSTIRGELQAHSRYSDMDNWVGRETADIVYTDRDGSLTRYLREHCSGGFPQGLRQDRDFVAHPIEYFLEVKTTTSACQTRFFMSGSQFTRMQSLAVSVFGNTSKVYVILRVFNLASRNVGLKIFVDPFRLRGQTLEFEVGTWHAKVRDGA